MTAPNAQTLIAPPSIAWPRAAPGHPRGRFRSRRAEPRKKEMSASRGHLERNGAVPGAPIRVGWASPLRVATGGAANWSSKARRRRSPAHANGRRDGAILPSHASRCLQRCGEGGSSFSLDRSECHSPIPTSVQVQRPSPKSHKSVSENCAGSCGEGFWLWPRRRGPSIPNAGCKDRANAGHGQKTRRPEGFRAKGRLASLLLSRRSREDILLRRASPSGLWRENRTPRNFRTRS